MPHWFWQLFKYGIIGVASTLVQTGVFYALAATVWPCLGADDLAVKFLSLPSAAVSDSVRATRFALATGLGFVVANLFCWVMNRRYVFTPGKFTWWVELGMFFGVSAVATLIATGLSWAFINYCGMMTTLAALVEVIVSFMVNFVVRKFVIFKG